MTSARWFVVVLTVVCMVLVVAYRMHTCVGADRPWWC